MGENVYNHLEKHVLLVTWLSNQPEQINALNTFYSIYDVFSKANDSLYVSSWLG